MPQEVSLHQLALHTLEVREKVFHALRINFDKLQVYVFPFQQILGKDAHSGPHFQRGKPAVQGIHDGAGHLLVCKEMLAQGLFCAYFCHTCKDNYFQGKLLIFVDWNTN